ncbi:MAG: AAA family ATPase, partial [Halomonadaceae bacterium]|nr:AAA family ATPase [Halomonadaceae bacterium]
MTSPANKPESQVVLMVPTSVGVGLTSASLGLMQALESIGLKAGFFKPFRQDELNGPGPDRSSALASSTLGVHPPAPIPQATMERLLRQDHLDVLMERVIELFDEAMGGHDDTTPDLIVVEGVVPTAHGTYATQLNAQLAHALNARIILVGSGDAAAPEALAEQLDMHARAFGGVGSARTLGCILMRMHNLPGAEASTLPPDNGGPMLDDAFLAELRRHSPALATERFHLIGVVPFNPALTAPRVVDVARALNARFLNEGEAATRRVLSTSLCARSAANALHVFRPGNLIVTPGDRDDIVLAAALATMNGVPMAGVLLTNGYMPNDNMVEMCRPALQTGMPVLTVDTDSFTTAKNLGNMGNDIPIDDLDRARQAMHFVAGYLDRQWLKDHLSRGFVRRLSPAAFRHQLVKLAQRANRRIVLPEGSEPRTVEAAIICQQRGIAHCVLLARPEEVELVARNRGLELPEGLEIIDPEPIRSRYIAPMVERRRGKVNELTAEDQLQDSVVLGTMMLQ